jgi:hypothetical protein
MIKSEIVLGVKDVEKSSEWYQKLLNCKSRHGGKTFEMLSNHNDEIILSLHRWGEHDHPTLKSPKIEPGNGLILYFRVDTLNEIWKNAKSLNANIEKEPHLNENSGLREFSLRDNDGYYISVCSENHNE